METCKRLQINLRNYLMDVLPRLPCLCAASVSEIYSAFA
jgi:hypothetical protein